MNALRLLTVSTFISFASPIASGEVIIWSEGMEVPETISQASPTFGMFGGHFFIPDAGIELPRPIHRVPPSGGPPTTFASVDFSPLGGLFLPDDFGALGGQYLVVGFVSGGGESRIVTIEPGGAVTDFATLLGSTYPTLTSPLIAPQGFGSVGGQLLVTNQGGDAPGIVAFDEAGQASSFASGFQGFGIAYAPLGFGKVGDTLLVSSNDDIFTVDSTGQHSLWTEIPLLPGQVSLRQIGFVPEQGFDHLNGLLLVSVSGSVTGGGTLGSLYAVDEAGNVAYTLELGPEFGKFDPRGVHCTDDGHFLISDASDPILMADPSDFIPGCGRPTDLDGDCDVDLDDFALFAGCLGGPGVPAQPECADARLDEDTDVDMLDFAQFQATFGS